MHFENLILKLITYTDRYMTMQFCFYMLCCGIAFAECANQERVSGQNLHSRTRTPWFHPEIGQQFGHECRHRGSYSGERILSMLWVILSLFSHSQFVSSLPKCLFALILHQSELILIPVPYFIFALCSGHTEVLCATTKRSILATLCGEYAGKCTYFLYFVF